MQDEDMGFQDVLEKISNRIKPNMTELTEGGDRACAVLLAALIDDALSELLKAFLVTTKGGSNSFAAKINRAHGLGLISSKLQRDMHRIRDIRNEFAHAGRTCTFETQSVKDRVSKIVSSFGKYAQGMCAGVCAQSTRPDRMRFTWCSLMIHGTLIFCAEETERLSEAADETIYLADDTVRSYDARS